MSIAIWCSSCLKARVVVRVSGRMVSLWRIRGCSSTVRFGNAGGGGERGDGIGPKLGAAWMVASTRDHRHVRVAQCEPAPRGDDERGGQLELDDHASRGSPTLTGRTVRLVSYCCTYCRVQHLRSDPCSRSGPT